MYIHKDRFLENMINSIRDDFSEPQEDDSWVQLKLNLYEEEKHKHKWYDDDGELCMGLYCECGAFSAVSFDDPWAGKTNHEVYLMLQKDRNLIES